MSRRRIKNPDLRALDLIVLLGGGPAESLQLRSSLEESGMWRPTNLNVKHWAVSGAMQAAERAQPDRERISGPLEMKDGLCRCRFSPPLSGLMYRTHLELNN